MTEESALSVKDGLAALRRCDDCITEIDAMMARLVKMKEQLNAQKDYTECALHDGTTDSAGDALTATTLGSSIIDPRVNRWRHTGRVRRVEDDGAASGHVSLTDKKGTGGGEGVGERKRRFGGKDGYIFNSTQVIQHDDATGGQNIKELEGMSLADAHNFLIAMNAVMTHSNDSSTNPSASTFTEAIVPTAAQQRDAEDGVSAVPGALSKNYKAGGKHKLNNAVLLSLIGGGSSNMVLDDGALVQERQRDEDADTDKETWLASRLTAGKVNTLAARTDVMKRVKGLGMQ